MGQSHLIKISDLSDQDIHRVVGRALIERAGKRPVKREPKLRGQTLALVFLEPSTRTRVSFELAAQSLGMNTVLIESRGTSFEKDESLEDALGVMRALGVRHFVIRTAERGALDVFMSRNDMMVMNAGDGAGEHPTQALLDAATMCRDLKVKSLTGLKGKKLGILGDVRRSRVARSWVELAARFEMDLSLIAPKAWQPTDFKSYGRTVTEKSKVLRELDYLMCLRVQKERMSIDEQTQVADFVNRFQVKPADLNQTRFKILHPGPVNWGVELSADLRGHARSLVNDQLQMSFFVRRQLLSRLSHSGSSRLGL